MRSALATCLVAAALLAGGPVSANTVAAPPAVTGVLPDARLAGEGDLRWYGLKVYTAQLWIADTVAPERLPYTPFALELRYATSLKGALIAERSAQEIERLGFGDAQRRERWLGMMKRVFPDIASGDRLTGVHEPGRATRFFHNDRPVGVVDDPDFGRAFFAIWLDERTVAPSLRRSLMRSLAGSPR
jgi:hypothetical protein